MTTTWRERARTATVVTGALAVVAGATAMALAADRGEVIDALLAAIPVVAGAALFLRAHAAGTPRTAPLPDDADVFDRAGAWFLEHGAVVVVVALAAIVGAMFAGVFEGETVGDDLTFHMAESRRLADCLAAGDWDFWNPSANGGYASIYYYQAVPQLASAIPAAIFGHHLFWFQLTLWLPQVATPVAGYRGLRLLGATPWQAACGAFAVTFVSGASRWGTGADGTFQVGLYTQTWALAAFPLGLGHGVRYLTRGDHLPAAIAWGAFVFLSHPFASIALCLALAVGTVAHLLRRLASHRVVQLVLLVIVALALIGNAIGFATYEAVPKRAPGMTVDPLPRWTLAGASLYIGPLLLAAALVGRLAWSVRRGDRGAPDVPGDDEPAPPGVRRRALGFAMTIGIAAGALLVVIVGYHGSTLGKLGLIAVIAAAGGGAACWLGWPIRDHAIVRLVVLGACLLIATAPSWLPLIIDRDGFGGFPHRVKDEVGPGYQELMRWYTKGALLDNARLMVLTWALPLVVLLARTGHQRWLWTPAVVYAALLAAGPHVPKTADDLLPAVRFLGAMQVVVALGIGAGLAAIGGLAWRRFTGDLRFVVRTAVVAAAVGLALVVGIGGGHAQTARVAVLESYGYRDEMMEIIDATTREPQGKKQVGPGCENHWWNLLSYVQTRRPSLLQMGGGGLQASPNYDFVWSVRDFPKLAWVYDTPLFVFAREKTSSPPAGEVLHRTARYELRKLPAPGPVSAVQVTGVLPEGESRANSPVRKAAIAWLRSDAAMQDKVLAYHGHGAAGPPPRARVVRAFHVDPSPGALADIYAEVEVEAPTTFVARASWHPRWHAYVDGLEVPVRRVTPDFPAIDVLPGPHTLAFRFERPWWANAVWLVWPGVALAAAAVLRRRRRPAELPPARALG